MGVLVAWSTPAQAACGMLGTNQTLYSPGSIASCDGVYNVAIQTDGNLVVYRGSTPIWATYKFGTRAKLVMQGDGNLVVYADQGVLWASNKFGSGATMNMQTDGNLVVYNGSMAPMWASGSTREAVLTNTNTECMGRCGASCNGWMPFGGGIYTSECMTHDQCVKDHGHLYPTCIALLAPAAVSYLVKAAQNLVKKAWNSVKHFFGW
jgi:hypothetical protein